MSANGLRVAIGALYNNGVGHARVFELNATSGTWVQIGGDIDGEASDDEFGWSLSLSADGSRVAIGAPLNDGTGTDAGHARVFEYVGASWVQLGVDIDGEAADDRSGRAVSLSADGTRLAIGARRNDGDDSDDPGHARVYEYMGGTWTQIGADIDGEAANDYTSHSVSLNEDGSRLSIGAGYNDGNGNDSGHVRVYEYSGGVWSQLGLDIDGEDAEDRSGFATQLSRDGSRVAVGAELNGGTNAGHVRVYEYSGGTWTQLGSDIDGDAENDRFGFAVSLSTDGSRLATSSAENVGYVRVFEYSSCEWTQIGGNLIGEVTEAFSGTPLSLSSDGSRIAIGSPANDAAGIDAGQTRIYALAPVTCGNGVLDTFAGETCDAGVSNGDDAAVCRVDCTRCGDGVLDLGEQCDLGTATNAQALSGCESDCTLTAPVWVQVGGDIDGEAAGDYSGNSVSMSANGLRVAIGGEFNDGVSGSDVGHTRVFEYTSGAWMQLGDDIDGEANSDTSAWWVSLSADGSRLAIGAPGNDGAGNSAGHARVLEYSGGAWVQLGTDIDGEGLGDESGRTVSLSADGTRLAIGAWRNDGNGTDSGHARVYEYMGGTWTQIGVDIDGEAAGDRSGESVSLSGDGSRLSIGSRYNDGNGNTAGHVRVYEYSGGVWSQLGMDIDGEAADDQSAFAAQISRDGSRVAIGAAQNDGSGNSAGHVRVYEYSSGVWVQIGSDLDGEAENDQFGFAVSLSTDGSRLAASARENDSNGGSAGHVRVFKYSSGEWTQIGDDIDGEAAGDKSGQSVSLSSDGARIAIGALLNDNIGSNAGHTRIYALAPVTCGNDVVDTFAGETCDAGVSNGDDAVVCRVDCTRCGDGVLDVGEQCDLGTATNAQAGSGCENDCTLTV